MGKYLDEYKKYLKGLQYDKEPVVEEPQVIETQKQPTENFLQSTARGAGEAFNAFTELPGIKQVKETFVGDKGLFNIDFIKKGTESIILDAFPRVLYNTTKVIFDYDERDLDKKILSTREGKTDYTNSFSKIIAKNLITEKLGLGGLKKAYTDMVSKPLTKWADDEIKVLDYRQQELLKDIHDEKEGLSNPREYAMTIASGTVSLSEAIGLLFLTRSPTATSALLSIAEASSVYQEAIDAGKSRDEALKIFAESGLGTFALEKLGLDYLIKGKSGGLIMKGLKTATVETLQEEGQTFWQNWIATQYDKDRKIYDGWWETAVGIFVPSFGAGMLNYSKINTQRNRLIKQIQNESGASKEDATKMVDTMEKKVDGLAKQGVVEPAQDDTIVESQDETIILQEETGEIGNSKVVTPNETIDVNVMAQPKQTITGDAMQQVDTIVKNQIDALQKPDLAFTGTTENIMNRWSEAVEVFNTWKGNAEKELKQVESQLKKVGNKIDRESTAIREELTAKRNDIQTKIDIADNYIMDENLSFNRELADLVVDYTKSKGIEMGEYNNVEELSPEWEQYINAVFSRIYNFPSKEKVTDIIDEIIGDYAEFETTTEGIPEETMKEEEAPTSISEMEKELRDIYKGKGEQADEALYQIAVELEIAEPGKRVSGKDNQGFDTWFAMPSTFPKWIPSEYRSSKAFKEVMEKLFSVDSIGYPYSADRSPAKNRDLFELYDVLLGELDNRIGVDTKQLRTKIKEQYARIKKEKVKKPSKRVTKGEKEQTWVEAEVGKLEPGQAKVGDKVVYIKSKGGKTVGYEKKLWEVSSILKDKTEKIKLVDSKGRELWTTPESIDYAEGKETIEDDGEYEKNFRTVEEDDVEDEEEIVSFKKTEVPDVDRTMPKAEAEKWLRKVFTEKEVKFLTVDTFEGISKKNLVIEGRATKGGRYFGTLIELVEKDGMVSDIALYHEAFHAFAGNFIDKEDMRKAYDVVKNSFITRPYLEYATRVNKYPKGDASAEEWIADDFARYVKNQKSYKGFWGIYRKLLDILNSWVRKKAKLESIYDDILKRKRPLVVRVSKEGGDIFNMVEPRDFRYPRNKVYGKKEDDALSKEARKYKSAEEFIDSIGTGVSDNFNPIPSTTTGKAILLKSYHGTKAKFDKFEIQKTGVRYTGDGIYFTPFEEGAKYYAGEDGRIIESYLDLKNPYNLYLPEDNIDWQPGNERIREIIGKGHDSIIVRIKDTNTKTGIVEDDTINEIVVFDTDRIKTKSEMEDIWNQANAKDTLKENVFPVLDFNEFSSKSEKPVVSMGEYGGTIASKYGSLTFNLGGVDGIEKNAPIELDQIFINKEYRRTGKGKELIKALQYIASQKKLDIEGLATQIENTPIGELNNFYESLGFEVEYRDEWSSMIYYNYSSLNENNRPIYFDDITVNDEEGIPKTVRVWSKSKFSNDGWYKDIPVIRKVENVTLYQGSKPGENRQFWTSNKKYAEKFGEVKEKTGTFYMVDNGNRVTDVYVEAKETEDLSQEAQVLRGTKGMTVDDIMKTYPNIKLTKDVSATDIHGNKVKIPEGEKLTPYELKGNKILLQDGETYIVSKNQFQNIKGNSIEAVGKPFAPELEGTEETVKQDKKGWLTEKEKEQLSRRELAEYEDSLAGEPTKYNQYTLPGGKNYKEILIKAPKKQTKLSSNEVYERADLLNTLNRTPEEDARLLELNNKLEKERATSGLDFRSSHWNEPNVISHIRLNEREYKGKNVTFLEEIQSDWAREGRDKGFRGDTPKQKKYGVSFNNKEPNIFFDTEEEASKRIGEIKSNFPKTDFSIKEIYVSPTTEYEESGKIPYNQLLKNWQIPTIKRALKEAVDNDSDYFAWITGEQTSARYNLATYVDNVSWKKQVSNPNEKSIAIIGKDNKTINFPINEKGIITESPTSQANWQGKKLDEVLGKGLADKIMAEDTGTLSGEGLKFGGEWASNLYDKQVKSIVEDLTGQKVEMIDMGLPIDKVKQNFYIVKNNGKDISPLTKDGIKLGQKISTGSENASGFGLEKDYVITAILKDGKFKAVPEENWKRYSYKVDFKTALERMRAIGASREETYNIASKTTTQQAIKLTPEVKAKIRGEAPKIETEGKMFEEIIPGKTISENAVELGSDQGGISDYLADKIAEEDYIEETVSINKLRKDDADLDSYLESGVIRDYEGEPFAMNPVVSSTGEVLDGYNRIAQELENGENKVLIYKGVPRNLYNEVNKKGIKYRITSNPLTTKILLKIGDRALVSKEFIQNLTNSPDIKQVEREIIRGELDKLEGNKIDVPTFIEAVKNQLLPLERITTGAEKARYESVVLPNESRGNIRNYHENIYSSPIKVSAGEVHFAGFSGSENYFGHTRTEDMANDPYTPPSAKPTVRRVLEVQSDLYQRGRLESSIGVSWGESGTMRDYEDLLVLRNMIGADKQLIEYGIEQGKSPDYIKKLREELAIKEKKIKPLEKQFKVLNQYTDPTAHFRMVREEVRVASTDGIKSLLFPTGETAMNIEGLGTEGGREAWAELVENGRGGFEEKLLTPEALVVGKEIVFDNTNDWVITEVLGDGKFQAVNKENINERETGRMGRMIEIDGIKKWINMADEETFDISGKVDTTNPIYKFYEKELGRYLKNLYGAVKITDDKGIEWFEVKIKPEYSEKPVTAFRIEDQFKEHGKRITPAQKEEIYRLNREIFGDDDIRIVSQIVSEAGVIGSYKESMIEIFEGQADAKDTFYHEAVHKYLDLFTTEEEHVAILNEAKKKYQSDNMEALEEKVAEDFIEYAKSREGIIGKLKMLFDKVIARINSYLGHSSEIDRLYTRILSNKKRVNRADKANRFRKYRLDKENLNPKLLGTFLKEGEKVKSRWEIANEMSEKFNVPVRIGKYKGKALGIYKVGKEIIRYKGGGIPTISHEFGHFFDEKLGYSKMSYMIDKKERKELLKEYGKKPKSRHEAQAEAFGEFMRFYITNESQAKEKAPGFYSYIDAVFKNDFPEIYQSIDSMRNDFKRWEESPATAKIMSQVSFNQKEKSIKERFVDTVDNLYEKTLDDLYGLEKRMTLAKQKGLDIPAEKDPEILARTLRGFLGKANVFLEEGTFNPKFWTEKNGKVVPEFTGKSLKEILKPIEQKKGLADLSLYLVAKRAEHLADRDKMTGIEKEDAIEAIKELDAKYPEFEKVAEEIYAFQDRVLRYAVDSGLLGVESYEKIKAVSKNYVPFFRVMDDVASGDYAKKGFANVSDEVKRLKGSDLDIVDPLESIIKNTYSILYASDRNKVGQAMAYLAEQDADIGKDFEKIPTPQAKVASVNIAQMLKDTFGSNIVDEVDIEDWNVIYDIFRPSLFLPSNVVYVRNGDKQSYYQVEPQLYRALMATQKEELSLMVKMLSYPTSLLRAGSTLAPDFGIRNPLRDLTTAWIYSKYGFLPIIDNARAIFDITKNSDNYKLWKLGGGEQAMLTSMDRDYTRKTFDEIVKAKGFTDYVKDPIEILRIISEFSEKINRLPEFNSALAKTGSPIGSAMASRDITIDFAKGGSTGRALNRIIAFWKAWALGYEKFFREMKQRPVATTFKATMAITLPSIILFLLNKDDERWKEVPQWQKDMFWIVMTEDNIYRIPKPFELGMIFGTLPERVMQFIYDRDPKSLDGLAERMFFESAPGIIPTAFEPLMENIANYDFFTGQKVVPDSVADSPPEYQYLDKTSETAKKIGELFKVSPLMLENVYYGYTSTLGRYATDGIDAIMKGTGIVPKRIDPEKRLSEQPVVRAFLVKNPIGSSSQSVADFYDIKTEIEGKEKVAKKLIQDGDFEKYKEYLADNEDLYMSYDSKTKAYYSHPARLYRQVAGDMADIRKNQKEIYKSMDMTPEEKRAKIDELDSLITNLAKKTINSK